jgi:phosphotransferase system enzyme I (PtsP)
VTKDGQKIALMINAGLAVDLPHIEETARPDRSVSHRIAVHGGRDASRTAEQFSLYRAVLDAAGERPVTSARSTSVATRALYAQRGGGNPALAGAPSGSGSIAGLLRSQIRPLAAAGGRELKVMFLMVATVEEFDEAKSLVERELTHLRRHSQGRRNGSRGINDAGGAVAALPARRTARARRLSLRRFQRSGIFHAADRGIARGRPVRCHPAPVLRALKAIADHGRTHAKPVTPCGTRPTPIGGWRSRSATARCRLPSAVGPVVAMLLDLNARKARPDPALIDSPAGSLPIRERLKAFAAEEGLQL